MILSTVLKYMDTKTLERMSSINDFIQSQYQLRLKKTLFSSQLITKSKELFHEDNIDKPSNVLINNYVVFNSYIGDSILIVIDNDCYIKVYDLISVKLKHKLTVNLSHPKEYVIKMHHYYNTSLKIDYIILGTNEGYFIIYVCTEDYTLRESQRLDYMNGLDLIKRQLKYKPNHFYPFQCITGDYIAFIKDNLSLISFEGKLLTRCSIHSSSNTVKSFTAIKDKQIYFYTYYEKSISTYQLIINKSIHLKLLNSFSSVNTHIITINYFNSQTNDEYLIESTSSSIIFWDFFTKECKRHYSFSLIDTIVAIQPWNDDIIYITTVFNKLIWYSFTNNSHKESPIVFQDKTFLSTIQTDQPSLFAYSSNGSLTLLSSSLND